MTGAVLDDVHYPEAGVNEGWGLTDPLHFGVLKWRCMSTW